MGKVADIACVLRNDISDWVNRDYAAWAGGCQT